LIRRIQDSEALPLVRLKIVVVFQSGSSARQAIPKKREEAVRSTYPAG
jgi:hypothetical protein